MSSSPQLTTHPTAPALAGAERTAEPAFPPPGPRSPGMVQALAWVLFPVPFLERCRRRYGPCFSIRLGPMRNVVVLSEPESIKAVFTGDPATLEMGNINGLFRPILGSRSILLLDGAEHMRHRRLLLPPFHGERVHRFGDQMADIARTEVSSWRAGGSISLLPRMQAVTTEVIMRAVFGIDDAPEHARLRALLIELLERCRSRSTMLPWLRHRLGGLAPWGRLMRTVKEIDAVLYAEIERRRGEPDLAERDDVLSLMLQARDEEGRPLEDVMLRDELLTLLVAGHETTASALAWTFEQVVRHPDALARLREELAAGREEYLEAVIQESQRLRPTLPIVARKLARPMTIGELELPAGTVVMPCVYLLHREPSLYPDPDEFRPERFLAERPGTYRWIPFGGGVRRCLGASFAQLEMRVVLREVLLRARLRAPGGPPEPIVRRSFIFAPGRGARVVVEAVDAG